jgi:hypothetical protein
MGTINFGDVPTWIAAIGTTGAFVVALVLLFQSLKQSKKDSADRRKEQAKLMSAWSTGVSMTKPYPTISFKLRNASEEPIYAISLRAAVGVRGTFIRHVGTLGPQQTADLHIYPPAAPRGDNTNPDVAFTDTAGVQWLRKANGQLTETNVDEFMSFFKEDPGAYDEIAKHPTLRLYDLSKATKDKK